MCWESHKYRASKTFPKAAPQMWFPWRNGITLVYEEYRDFLGSSVVKNLPANAGDIRDTGSTPESGRSPGGEHGNSLQCSCLENPTDRGAWRVTVHRVAKSQTPLKQLRSSSNKGVWSPTANLFSFLTIMMVINHLYHYFMGSSSHPQLSSPSRM